MATMRGKTSKTVALPGFCKIKRSGGSGGCHSTVAALDTVCGNIADSA
jgi:hypothetical protein